VCMFSWHQMLYSDSCHLPFQAQSSLQRHSALRVVTVVALTPRCAPSRDPPCILFSAASRFWLAAYLAAPGRHPLILCLTPWSAMQPQHAWCCAVTLDCIPGSSC
jgi:hypothetical protein